LSGLVSSRQISLKSEYFTKITAPFGLALLLLIGICPYLLRRGPDRSWRTLGAAGIAIAAAGIWWLAHSLAFACLVICGFVATNLVVDFVRHRCWRTLSVAGVALVSTGIWWLAPGLGFACLSWCGLFAAGMVLNFVLWYRRNRNSAGAVEPRIWNARSYGARIVHIGVLLAFIGIAGSGGFDIEKQVALQPGERAQIGDFELVYDDLKADHGPNFTAVTADVSVYKGAKRIDLLSPSVAFYAQSGKRTSEVDVRRTLAGDLYLALTEVGNANKINLTVYIKPLINWIWIGNVLMVVGTGLVVAAVVGRKRGAPQGDTIEI
jgi:cytochrome c-type biogenesis protein CcmF